MPVQGTPKFNGVTLLEIGAISFRSGVGQFVAHGAYVNTETGATYGKVPCQHFSKETMALVTALRNSIEMDLALTVLYVDGSDDASPMAMRSNVTSDEPGGIGEHANGETEADPA